MLSHWALFSVLYGEEKAQEVEKSHCLYLKNAEICGLFMLYCSNDCEYLDKIKEEDKKMSLQVEKLEHNMAKLTIEVSAEEVEKALQAAYIKNMQKSACGFRKGRESSRQMIEKCMDRRSVL